MTERVEIVRRWYEAAGRRDWDAAAACVAPEFVLDRSRSLLDPQIVEGREAATSYAAGLLTEAPVEFTLEPAEFLENGDKVLVCVSVTARGTRSGATVATGISAVWTVDGLAKRCEYFGDDRAAALADAGIEDRP